MFTQWLPWLSLLYLLQLLVLGIGVKYTGHNGLHCPRTGESQVPVRGRSGEYNVLVWGRNGVGHWSGTCPGMVQEWRVQCPSLGKGWSGALLPEARNSLPSKASIWVNLWPRTDVPFLFVRVSIIAMSCELSWPIGIYEAQTQRNTALWKKLAL